MPRPVGAWRRPRIRCHSLFRITWRRDYVGQRESKLLSRFFSMGVPRPGGTRCPCGRCWAKNTWRGADPPPRSRGPRPIASTAGALKEYRDKRKCVAGCRASPRTVRPKPDYQATELAFRKILMGAPARGEEDGGSASAAAASERYFRDWACMQGLAAHSWSVPKTPAHRPQLLAGVD